MKSTLRVNPGSGHSALNSKSGQALILVLIFLVAMSVTSVALFSRVAGFVRSVATSAGREKATHLAEAGVDYAVWQLNKPTGGTPDTSVPVRVGVGEFDTDVTGAGDSRTIISKGCIPGCNNLEKQTRVIKVGLQMVQQFLLT